MPARVAARSTSSALQTGRRHETVIVSSIRPRNCPPAASAANITGQRGPPGTRRGPGRSAHARRTEAVPAAPAAPGPPGAGRDLAAGRLLLATVISGECLLVRAVVPPASETSLSVARTGVGKLTPPPP